MSVVRPAFRVECGALTHVGKIRSNNEDSCLAREESGLWAVADGMGGHEGGEWASAKIVEELGGAVLPADMNGACEAIAAAIHAANAAVLRQADRRGKQMGSTVVALLVRGDRFVVFWVGDSRAYLLRDGQLLRISRDHSQVQEMLDRGLISAEEANGHPMGHVLARAVGVAKTLELDSRTGEVEPGDVFLLCSDGLHGFVPEADIARVLARGAAERSAEQLVDATLERGAPDNVTVITIMFTEPTLLSIPGSATA